MNYPTIFLQAVDNLCGLKVRWQVFGDDKYENITFHEIYEGSGGKIPTKDEVEAEVNKLLGELNATEYQRKRAAEYPAIGDQLDMIYKAGQGGDAFQAAIKAVKDKYPKPE